TGLTSLRSVQIAETPIAPAPTKRTFVLQVFCASVAAAIVMSPAIVEKCGTPQPQPINAPISIAIPTDKPTRCPIPRRANDKKKSYPLTAPRLLIRKVCATSAANTCVWTMTANTAATIEPHSTASRPALPCSMSEACFESLLLPTLSTSAHATPSGYGKSEVVTSARRRGIEYITPRIPPSAQIQNEIQNGNSVHQPIMIRPGNTKMIDESVPAAEATVCTMLFSCTVASRKLRSIAIEITAAGIDVEKVRPALRPKYTLAAVNTNVMMIPMIIPRTVSSLRIFAVMFADRRERRIVWNRRKGQDDIALAELECFNAFESCRIIGKFHFLFSRACGQS